MIPNVGCDPKINVVSIGAKIIQRLMDGNDSLHTMMAELPSELGVSQDHIIISMDWLYLVNAINLEGDKVFLNET